MVFDRQPDVALKLMESLNYFVAGYRHMHAAHPFKGLT